MFYLYLFDPDSFHGAFVWNSGDLSPRHSPRSFPTLSPLITMDTLLHLGIRRYLHLLLFTLHLLRRPLPLFYYCLPTHSPPCSPHYGDLVIPTTRYGDCLIRLLLPRYAPILHRVTLLPHFTTPRFTFRILGRYTLLIVEFLRFPLRFILVPILRYLPHPLFVGDIYHHIHLIHYRCR